MGLAPLLYATHIIRPTEIVSVLRFLEPKLLTCCFAGLAAFGFGTISLVPPVAMVRSEENTTTPAFALSHSFYHCPLTSAGQWINSERKQSIKKGRKRKVKKILCGFLEKKIQGMGQQNQTGYFTTFSDRR